MKPLTLLVYPDIPRYVTTYEASFLPWIPVIRLEVFVKVVVVASLGFEDVFHDVQLGLVDGFQLLVARVVLERLVHLWAAGVRVLAAGVWTRPNAPLKARTVNAAAS